MPRVVDKKEKAARIGAAAISVFRRFGYDATRMADIAAAAAVGKGTLYEYFRSKDEIFRFEFERYFEAFEAGAGAAMAAADSPGDRLRALIGFAFDHVGEWEDHCAVYVDYFGSARSENDAAFLLSGMYAEVEAIIRKLIDAGQASGEIDADVSPDATAQFLVCVFEGVVLHSVFSGRARKGKALRAAALRLLDHGMFIAPAAARPLPKRKGDRRKRKR
jgi:AcrR family transcriptional regulator